MKLSYSLKPIWIINPKMYGQELVSVGSVQKKIGVIATTQTT